MKALEEMLAEKKSQLATLKVEIATLEAAMRRASGEEAVTQRPRRSKVKQIVLDILKERGDEGINAALAVEIAAKRGEKLERGTVSSLLSRMKADGIVTYDNVFYRLNSKPKSAPPLDQDSADLIH